MKTLNSELYGSHIPADAERPCKVEAGLAARVGSTPPEEDPRMRRDEAEWEPKTGRFSPLANPAVSGGSLELGAAAEGEEKRFAKPGRIWLLCACALHLT